MNLSQQIDTKKSSFFKDDKSFKLNKGFVEKIEKILPILKNMLQRFSQIENLISKSEIDAVLSNASLNMDGIFKKGKE